MAATISPDFLSLSGNLRLLLDTALGVSIIVGPVIETMYYTTLAAWVYKIADPKMAACTTTLYYLVLNSYILLYKPMLFYLVTFFGNDGFYLSGCVIFVIGSLALMVLDGPIDYLDRLPREVWMIGDS